jgi:hypothetical protein
MDLNPSTVAVKRKSFFSVAIIFFHSAKVQKTLIILLFHFFELCCSALMKIRGIIQQTLLSKFFYQKTVIIWVSTSLLYVHPYYTLLLLYILIYIYPYTYRYILYIYIHVYPCTYISLYIYPYIHPYIPYYRYILAHAHM